MRQCPRCGSMYRAAVSARDSLDDIDEDFERADEELDALVDEALRTVVSNVPGSARRPAGRWPRLLSSAQRQITQVLANPSRSDAANILIAATRALEEAADELALITSGSRQNAVLNPIVNALYNIDAARRAQRGTGNFVSSLNAASQFIHQTRRMAVANLV